jgi:hypothetical protein
VEAVNAPAVSHGAIVTMKFGRDRVEFHARVRYVEPRMGFGVAFDVVNFPQATAMALVLGRPVV